MKFYDFLIIIYHIYRHILYEAELLINLHIYQQADVSVGEEEQGDQEAIDDFLQLTASLKSDTDSDFEGKSLLMLLQCTH